MIRDIAVAAAAALPVILFQPVAAEAACNGSVTTPNSNAVTILCNDQGGALPPITVPTGDNTTYVDTSTRASGSNTLLQFDGQGRFLINNGSIINNRVINGGTGRNHTAILMGASTVNAGNGTNYTSTYDSGTNTTTIAVTGGTPSSAWIGQTITVGNYDGDDFSPANSFLITGVSGSTVTVSGELPAGYMGGGTNRYSIVANYGGGSTVDGAFYNNVILNNREIHTEITRAEIIANQTGVAPALASPSNIAAPVAINTSVSGSYLIQNSEDGEITATHDGMGGNLRAIVEGGNVTSLTVVNAGEISITRTAPLTLVTNTATANQTVSSTAYAGYAPVNLGSAATLWSEEEAEEFTLRNSGVVRATGDYLTAMYMRGEESRIVNRGLIEHLSYATIGATEEELGAMTYDERYGKGFAIGAVSNGGEVREIEMVNTGTIRGDILAVNGNAYRWYTLSTEGASDTRLTINSHTGQLNSEIASSGTIVGNLWYSNGRHELENSGTLRGDIDVDQRDTTYSNGANVGASLVLLPGAEDDDDEAPGDPVPSNNTAQGTNYVIRGDKRFIFENSGIFAGQLAITNATSTYTNALFNGNLVSGTVSSNNTIVSSGLFEGNITIDDVAGATNTVTLIGDGFGRSANGSLDPMSGNLTALNGTGDNILNLAGRGTLRGTVTNFPTLNVIANTGGGGDEPDDDDDDDEGGDDDSAGMGPGSGAPTFWTLPYAQYDFETINVFGGATLAFDATDTVLDVDHLELRAPTSSTPNFQPASYYAPFASGGILQVGDGGSASRLTINTGDSTLVNRGTMSMVNDLAGDRLVVNGPYVSRGGNLAIDTFVYNASSRTDRLLLNGPISGRTTVYVNNLNNGNGTLTGHGAGDGIRIVSASEPLSASDLRLGVNALSGAREVTSGIYSYQLAFFGNSAYLQSDMLDQVGGYATAPSVATMHTYAGLETLYQRMGELRSGGAAPLGNAGGLPEGDPSDHFWVRGSFANYDVDVERGWDFDSDTNGFLVGYDPSMEMGTGILHYGVFGGYSGTNSSVDGRTWNRITNSSVDVEGWTLGAYATYFQNQTPGSGFYADVVGKIDGLNIDVSNSNRGTHASTDATGFTGSGEIGYGFDFGGGWSLQPNGQLTFISVETDKYTEAAYNLLIDSGDADSTIGRVGLQLENRIGSAGGAEYIPYVNFNVLSNFDGDNRTVVAGTGLVSDIGGTWYDVGGGITASWSDRYALYANLDYKFGDVEGLGGTVGGKIRW